MLPFKHLSDSTRSSWGFTGYKRFAKGFTLAELLIALAILGVIATFTIPKVLQAQQDQRNNAIAKETIATLSGAYQLYRGRNTVTASTGWADLTPYMNYVSIDTAGTSTVDAAPFEGASHTCDGTTLCFLLHNGGKIWWSAQAFAGTTTTNGLYFLLDPDGKDTGKKDSLYMVLYFDGKVRTSETAIAGLNTGGAFSSGGPGSDPTWFKW